MAEAFTGEIRLLPYFTSRTLLNWTVCQGQLLKISDYEALFSVIGVKYGGDGVSTFGVPNLNGRIAVGQGNGTGLTPRVAGQMGGTEAVTLTQASIPNHSHALCATPRAATANVPASALVQASGAGSANFRYLYPIPSPAPKYNALTDAAIGLTGENQAHSNVMPSLCLKYFMCSNGLYPQRAS